MTTTPPRKSSRAVDPKTPIRRPLAGTPVVGDVEDIPAPKRQSLSSSQPTEVVRKRRKRDSSPDRHRIADPDADQNFTPSSGERVLNAHAVRRAKPRYRLTNGEKSRVDVSIKPLDQIMASSAPPAGKLPPNAAARNRAQQPEVWQDDDRHWPERTVFWEATNYEHQPLYFEEINLERHGYDHGCLQPVFSAGNFYGSVALWPYKLVCYPWYECQSPLGHYRPGSCAPYRCHRLPLRLDAALVEVGAWTGLAFLLP